MEIIGIIVMGARIIAVKRLKKCESLNFRIMLLLLLIDSILI